MVANDTEETTVRHRRRLRWVGLGALVLVIVMILLFDGSRSRALDRATRQARAGGRPFTLQEIEVARTAWPEDQNGAAVLLAIRTHLDDLKEQNPYDHLPWIGDTPILSLGEQWTDEDHIAVQVFLKEVQPLLDQIDRLRGYRGGRLPFDTNFDLLQSDYDIGFIRTACKIKSLQALQRAMAGDNARLVDDLTILLNIGRLLDEDPTLIGALVRIACDGQAVTTLERVCALAPLEPGQLIEIDRLLAGIENSKRLYWGMLGERAASFDLTRNTPSNVWKKPGSWFDATHLPGIRGWMMQDQAAGLHLLNRLVDAAADPENSLPIAQEVDLQVQQLSAIGHPLSKILLPSLPRSFTLNLKLTAQIRAARGAIAAERYRLDHACFPESLELLVPVYLDRLPPDPFAAQPLKYRQDGERLVIYSVGEDLKDDGGDVQRKNKNTAPKDCGFTLLAPIERNRCSPLTAASATRPADR